VRRGRVHFDPVLLEEVELPDEGALTFTWARVPYTCRRGSATRLRVLGEQGWLDGPDLSFDPSQVQAVEAQVCFEHR
jgi:hypothetical protein